MLQVLDAQPYSLKLVTLPPQLHLLLFGKFRHISGDKLPLHVTPCDMSTSYSILLLRSGFTPVIPGQALVTGAGRGQSWVSGERGAGVSAMPPIGSR